MIAKLISMPLCKVSLSKYYITLHFITKIFKDTIDEYNVALFLQRIHISKFQNSSQKDLQNNYGPKKLCCHLSM